jgi:hypothetical protein
VNYPEIPDSSPCTGNLLLANPPFIFQPMDINQPTTAKGLSELTEEEFQQLSVDAGGSGKRWAGCNYAHSLRIAQRAYAKGADVELEACSKWLENTAGGDLFLQAAAVDIRAARRPKSPTLKEQALAAARIEVNPHGKNGALIIRALEALPD